MASLNAAQRRWLNELGAMVGAGEPAPETDAPARLDPALESGDPHAVASGDPHTVASGDPHTVASGDPHGVASGDPHGVEDGPDAEDVSEPSRRPGGREATARPPAPVEVLEDRRREFKRARAQWVAVKQKAEADLEKVKEGARKVYRADADQFPKVVAGCKAIDAILDNLDDELRDTLDRYASTPLRAQAKLATLAASASEVIARYQKYVARDPVMRAIDEKEFADVVVHAPVTKALRDLRKALS